MPLLLLLLPQLIIGEDTSNHQNDALWVYDLKTAQLQRILTTPYGAETTSPYFYPNFGGHAYIAASIQHPYGACLVFQGANLRGRLRRDAFSSST